MNYFITQLNHSIAADRRQQIPADVMGSGNVRLFADSAIKASGRCHALTALRGEPMT